MNRAVYNIGGFNMETGYIYKIINTVNGKIYVGQTVQALDVRYSRHVWDAKNGSNTALGRAIRKYGRGAFIIRPLGKYPVEDLDAMEIKFIADLRTKSPNGYNLTDGGEGTRGAVRTEEWRRKMSEAVRGEKHPLYGKTGELSPNYGKKWTEETRRKMSEAKLGVERSEEAKRSIRAGKARPVRGYDLRRNIIKRFNSTREASEWLVEQGYAGKSSMRTVQVAISAVLRGDKPKAFGFTWELAE